MNFYYLISVVGSRIFNLFSAIILSYILSANEYGKFTVITTNALFLHILFTSWICSNLWKDVSQAEPENRDRIISEGMAYGFIGVIVNVIIFFPLFLCLSDKQQYISFVFLLSPLIFLIEVTLVVLNAKGEDRMYGWLSFSRGLLCLVLSVILVFSAHRLLGAIAGQILGISTIFLVSSQARAIIRLAKFDRFSWHAALPKLRFGFISAIALNLYMVANALIRNVIALDLGEADAGFYSIAADIFYAPVALFSMTLSLMKTPDLYRANSSDAPSDPQPSIDFIMANLALAVPYAVGGAMVAPLIAQMLLSENSGTAVSLIASHGAIQGACFIVISTLTTLALTQVQVKAALIVSIASLVVLLGAVALATKSQGLVFYAENVTIALMLIAICCLAISWRHFHLKLSVAELGKIIFATFVMAATIWLALTLLSGYWKVIAAISAGSATFLGTSLLLKSRVVSELIRPKRGMGHQPNRFNVRHDP